MDHKRKAEWIWKEAGHSMSPVSVLESALLKTEQSARAGVC